MSDVLAVTAVVAAASLTALWLVSLVVKDASINSQFAIRRRIALVRSYEF